VLIELQVIVALAVVVAIVVMSILDFALGGVSKLALRRLAEAMRGPSALRKTLSDSPGDVLMAIHIMLQALLIGLAVLLSAAALQAGLETAVALPAAAGATVVLVLIFRQLVPRAIARRDPEAVLEKFLPIVSIPYYPLSPVVALIGGILGRFEAWEVDDDAEEDEASDEEIRAFIDAGQEEGILEQEEGVMVRSVVEFGDTVAFEVMTPRTQIVAADVSWSIDRITSLVVSSRHSRIPVYRDELDNIEGVIHERDLLGVLQSGKKPESVRTLLSAAHFIPETKPISDLLEELRGHGQQLALVVDEYGGISGLITIEDLVEEIVGEIEDGPHSETERMREEGAGRFIVPGSMALDALETSIGVDVFPATESTTVGGAVVELFGRLPLPGERLGHNGYTIEVVEADRRRVRTVRIRAAKSQSG
jgi:CBS domain containing-hemolysin-like protein